MVEVAAVAAVVAVADARCCRGRRHAGLPQRRQGCYAARQSGCSARLSPPDRTTQQLLSRHSKNRHHRLVCSSGGGGGGTSAVIAFTGRDTAAAEVCRCVHMEAVWPRLQPADFILHSGPPHQRSSTSHNKDTVGELTAGTMHVWISVQQAGVLAEPQYIWAAGLHVR